MAKILVVDQYENKRLWLKKVLSEAGHEVVYAEDGEAGLVEFQRQEPDAVLLTMTLPRISGSELSLRLKNTAAGQTTPVILTSPLFTEMALDEIARRQWKADAFLEEPYTKKALLLALDTQIRAYASKQVGDGEIDPFSHLKKGALDPLEAAMTAADIATAGLEMEEAGRIRKEKAPPPQEPSPSPSRSMAAEVEEGLLIDPEGDLSETSIPEIFAALFFARATGILRVTSNEVTKKVYLRGGSPVHVESRLREETLGQILLTHGLINEEQRHDTLQSMSNESVKQGDALIDIGALSPTQLYQALKLQAQEKALSLFTWHSGDYAFQSQDFSTEGMTIFEMWTPTLILQGVLRYYEAPHIRSIFNELKDFVLKRRPSPPVIFNDLKFPSEVSDFMAGIDGKRSVGEVVKESPLPPGRTYQVFFVLLILEQFDKIDPGQKGETRQEELPDAGISLDGLIADIFADDAASPKDEPAPVLSLADQLEPPASPPPSPEPEDTGADRTPVEAPMPDRAQKDMAQLFRAKDAESGEDRSTASVPVESEADSASRVAFDLDAEEDGVSPVEEIHSHRSHRRKPDATLEAAPADGKEKTETGRDIPMSEELSKVLNEFLEDVDKEAAEPDLMEETVQIMVDDLAAGKTPERPVQEKQGIGATLSTLAESREPQELELLQLSKEDQELMDQILADFLALAKANHYEILHVKEKATDADIRNAYMVLIKKFHPDRLQNRFPDEILQKAGEVVAKTTDAYRTLYDYKRRKEYDKTLVAGEKKKGRSVAMVLKAERLFTQGVAAINQSHWAEARKLFAEAVELFPIEGEYHAYLGWAIYNLTDQPRVERTRQARSMLEKAIRLNPRSDKSYYYLGLLLKDNDMLDKAALMFAQAYRYNKNNIPAKNQLKAIQLLRSRRPGADPAVRGKGPRKKDKLLQKDINFNSVKKAVLKIFW